MVPFPLSDRPTDAFLHLMVYFLLHNTMRRSNRYPFQRVSHVFLTNRRTDTRRHQRRRKTIRSCYLVSERLEMILVVAVVWWCNTVVSPRTFYCFISTVYVESVHNMMNCSCSAFLLPFLFYFALFAFCWSQITTSEGWFSNSITTPRTLNGITAVWQV